MSIRLLRDRGFTDYQIYQLLSARKKMTEMKDLDVLQHLTEGLGLPCEVNDEFDPVCPPKSAGPDRFELSYWDKVADLKSLSETIPPDHEAYRLILQLLDIAVNAIELNNGKGAKELIEQSVGLIRTYLDPSRWPR